MLRFYPILAILWLLAFVFPVAAQDNLLPEPTGTYPVSVTTRHWIDESRDETYTPDVKDDKRELMVYFWYPAEADAAAQPALYMPDAAVQLPSLTDLFRQITGRTVDFPLETFAGLRSHAYSDAPLASAEPAYPVLIFSPGWVAWPQLYSSQLEELASHGYIVAAINHPYAASATVFPDGHSVTADLAASPLFSQEVWTQDQVFVLDQVQILNTEDPEGFFTGRLNLDQIGVFGHSLGGYASMSTCSSDTRCKAFINEDGDLDFNATQKGYSIPFMVMSHERSPLGEFYFQNSTGPSYNLIFRGYDHNNFTDASVWPTGFLALGSVDGMRSLQVTNAYVLAFFNHYLKGLDEPLMQDESPDYPEVKFGLFLHG